MQKKKYETPTLERNELLPSDLIRTSGSITDKDVIGDDVYGDEIWN